MNCPNCNQPLEKDSFFCKNCGKWIVRNEGEKTENREPSAPRPRRKPSRRRIRRRNTMLVILALVLILGVVAIYSLALAPTLGNQPDATDQSDPENPDNADQTNQPDEAVDPQPTDTPDATPDPQPTDDPDDTSDSQPEDKPDETVNPQPAETPGSTTNPQPSEQPETPNSSATAVYLLPSDTRTITEADLEGMTQEQVALARNEIYARHGRTFRNEDYNNYFRAQSWYTPDPNYSDATVNLSALEKSNAEVILSYEKSKGWK